MNAEAAARALASAKVLIVHEWLTTWGGAERCLDELLTLVPHADVIAGVVSEEMREAHAAANRARETWLGRIPGARAHYRWLLPVHPLAFRGIDTSEYDIVLSLSHSFGKSVRAQKPGASHVCYCMTPPRYLWDLASEHAELATPVQRAALAVAGGALRRADLRAASGVDQFLCISKVAADRVQRTYGRSSTVVYPPVSAATWQTTRGGFLLSLGRLVPYKRVDLAIDAAERLGIPLIVAGDGPERTRLERRAGRHTTILGHVSESTARGLLAECAAFVFCAEEDFGIAPLEANAYGAPVVAFGRGGALETMVAGQSAVFFERQEVDAVCDAIVRCRATTWDERVMRENAARFSADRFRASIGAALAARLRAAT